MQNKVTKIENLFQIQKEGITTEAIFRFPFVDGQAGAQINLQGWRFMDIVSDGAINPDNIGLGITAGLFPACQITFDDLETRVINREAHNIPLINKSFLRYYNLPPSPVATRTYEAGYGNLFIILKNYPTEPKIKKHNPFYCGQVTIPADTLQIFWIGTHRPVGTDTLLIPFVPYGYSHFHYCLAQGADITTTLTKYFCFMASCDGGGLAAGCGQVVNCTSHLRFNVTNAHAENPEIWKFVIFFVGKADASF